MSDPLLIIDGPEQSRLHPDLPDGGLPPVVGVESYQVFRASKDVPQLTDGKGWTYHHHVDMACWRGRLYVGWNSCERDEDVWPSRELYSTSIDGKTWTSPLELFPQGVSTPLRMYFFRTTGPALMGERMLAIAGMRTGTADTSEDKKGPLVVREIASDHALREVFTLQGEPGPPSFERSSDSGFVEACRQLLADHVFLEQQDRGKLLGERRMKWHDASAWPAGSVPGDSDKWVAGKAYSFFRRRDGALVGVSKMGWTTISRDDGKNWTQPTVPPTLITGKAKVWSQQTRGGRYVLAYNPSRRNRFPLVIVTSDDGITFRDMRIVQGELPVQRYAGLHRSIGPQYVRGISTWADDGSRSADHSLWLVYSMSKEDIWVSRVPVPVQTDEAIHGISPTWNVYSPKWAPVAVRQGEVRLEDADSYDYAAATRLLRTNRDAAIEFDLFAEQAGAALHIEVVGDATAVHRPITPGAANQWQAIAIQAESANRITFRTGPPHGIGGAHPVSPGTDVPHDPIAFRIRNVRVRSTK